MSVYYNKRLRWHQQATAITASTTPPADALITLEAAPSDTVGIHVPEHIGDDLEVLAELTTAGGAPGMLVRLYGYVRWQTNQAGVHEQYLGAASTGRWVWVADLNGGSAITAAAYPQAVPAANTLTWVERIQVGGQYERLMGWLWSATGTTPTLNVSFGWGGAES